MLESFYRAVGGFGSFRVDCEPFGASVVQYYRYRVGGKTRIVLNTVLACAVFGMK